MALIMIALLSPILATAIAAADTSSTKLKDDSCAPYDSCGAGEFFRTCSCDDDCYQYGTCCSDSAAGSGVAVQPEPAFSCHDDESTVTPTFAKGSCAADFAGSEHVISGCQEVQRDPADLLANLLVSSNETLETYWNWNCAICNHEEPSSVLHWNVQVSCPASHHTINDESIRERLIFARRSWGLDTGGRFVPCSVRFMQPDSLVNRLRYCAPNMISSCPREYADREVIQKCEQYHGERKHKGRNTYYKNVHCALCNGASLKQLECFGRNYRPHVGTSDVNVIKVIFKSGTWVGDLANQYKCREGEAYDPFTQMCRTYVLPDYDYSNPGTRTAVSVTLWRFLLMFCVFAGLQSNLVL